MANDPRKDVAIDPAFFFVPEDVVDVRAGSGDDPDPSLQVEENWTEDAADTIALEDATTIEDVAAALGIETPQSLTIVSQEVRVAPDGRSLVDIVLDVEDVPGASNYELRVTKA